MDWYLKVMRNYVGFSGRARRKEYWMFALFNIIISVVLMMVDGMLGLKMGGEQGAGVLGTLYTLAVLMPSIAVGVRRLHDTGRSGWWMLLVLVPLIGPLVLLVFFVSDGQPGSNEYGANPKGV